MVSKAKSCNLIHHTSSLHSVTFPTLGKAEVFSTRRHGRVHGLAKVLVRFVLWKIQLVETGVRGWQAVLVTVIAMDVEPAETVHALKLLEAVEGHFAGTSDELQ